MIVILNDPVQIREAYGAVSGGSKDDFENTVNL
jgi:hypothetical protein